MSWRESPAELLAPGRPLTLASVADGAEGLVVADLARAIAARPNAPATSLLVVCRDGPRMAALSRALAFFAPDIAVLEFPAWDCLPYDRVSPHAGVRRAAHDRRCRGSRASRAATSPSVLLTTVNAALQRVPAKSLVAEQSLSAAPGNVLAHGRHRPLARAQRLRARLDRARARRLRGARRHPRPLSAGHGRAGAARFLRRHAGIDPQLRSGDASAPPTSCARSTSCRSPNSSSPPKPSGVSALGYVAAFGAPTPDDLLYEAVSEGRRYPGMEHWLPLFHDRLDTLFDYLPGSPVVLEPLAEDAAHERLAQIADYYEARQQALAQRGCGPPYQPLPPDRLYLAEAEWRERLEQSQIGAADAVRGAGRAGAVDRCRHASRATISPPSAPSRAATCSRR